jgi:phosphoglycolate phosphatase
VTPPLLLIFDLDGTLVDSIHDLAEAASDLSSAHGGPRLDDDAVALMIGEGTPVLVQRVLARVGQETPAPGALEQFLEFYERRMFDTTRPYPGVIDMLRVLVDSHALALLTNKPEASSRRVLQHTGLDGFFSHMVFGDSAPGRKPAPDGLRWLMGRNGASAERTMLIGDSDVDVGTARAAGVRLCIARYGFGFVRVDPGSLCDDDILIDQPSDLVAALNAP